MLNTYCHGEGIIVKITINVLYYTIINHYGITKCQAHEIVSLCYSTEYIIRTIVDKVGLPILKKTIWHTKVQNQSGRSDGFDYKFYG